MNSNEKCLLAIPMLVILMLILMLLNLNTGYADTDADLCIRIMSLCCTPVVLSVLLCTYKCITTATLFALRFRTIKGTGGRWEADEARFIAEMKVYYFIDCSPVCQLKV